MKSCLLAGCRVFVWRWHHPLPASGLKDTCLSFWEFRWLTRHHPAITSPQLSVFRGNCPLRKKAISPSIAPTQGRLHAMRCQCRGKKGPALSPHVQTALKGEPSFRAPQELAEISS